MFSSFFSRVRSLCPSPVRAALHHVKNYLKPEIVPGLREFLDFRSYAPVFTNTFIILFLYHLASLGLEEDDHKSFAWALAMVGAACVFFHGARKQAGSSDGSSALACLQGSFCVLSLRSAAWQISNVCWYVEGVKDDVCYYIEDIQDSVENLVYSIVSPIWRSIHWPTFFLTLLLLLFLRLSTSRESLPQHTPNTLGQFGKVRIVHGVSSEEARLRDELAQTQALLDQTLATHVDEQQNTLTKLQECKEDLDASKEGYENLKERNGILRQQVESYNHECEAIKAQAQKQLEDVQREAEEDRKADKKVLSWARRDIAQLKKQLNDVRSSEEIAVRAEERERESKLQKRLSAMHAKLEKSNAEKADLRRQLRQTQEENATLQSARDQRERSNRAFTKKSEEIKKLNELVTAEREKVLAEEKASHDLRTRLNEKDAIIDGLKEQLTLQKEKASVELQEMSKRLQQAQSLLDLKDLDLQKLSGEKQEYSAAVEEVMGLLQRKDDEARWLNNLLTAKKGMASIKTAEQEQEPEMNGGMAISDAAEEQKENCVEAGNDTTSNDKAGTDDKPRNNESGNAATNGETGQGKTGDDQTDAGKSSTDETDQEEVGNDEAVDRKRLNDETSNGEVDNSETGNNGAEDKLGHEEKSSNDSASADNATHDTEPGDNQKNGSENDSNSKAISEETVEWPAGPEAEQGADDKDADGVDEGAAIAKPDDSHEPRTAFQPDTGTTSDSATEESPNAVTEEGPASSAVSGEGARATAVGSDDNHKSHAGLQVGAEEIPSATTEKSSTPIAAQETSDSKVGSDRASIDESSEKQEPKPAPRLEARETSDRTIETPSNPAASQKTTDNELGRGQAVEGEPSNDVIPPSSTQPDLANNLHGAAQKPSNSVTYGQTPASEVSSAGASGREPKADHTPVSSNDTGTGVPPASWVGPPATPAAAHVGDTDMTDVETSPTEPAMADEVLPDAAPAPAQAQSQDLDELPEAHDESLQNGDCGGDSEMEEAAPEQATMPQPPVVPGDGAMRESTNVRLGGTTGAGEKQPVFAHVPKGMEVPGLFASAKRSRARAAQRRDGPKHHIVRRTGPNGGTIKVQGASYRYSSAYTAAAEQFAVSISGRPQTGSGFHTDAFAFAPQNGAPTMQFLPTSDPQNSQTDATIPATAPQYGIPTSQFLFTSGPQSSQTDANSAVTAPQQASAQNDARQQAETFSTYEEYAAIAIGNIKQAETNNTVADHFNAWVEGLKSDLANESFDAAELKVYFNYACIHWTRFGVTTLERVVRSANLLYTHFVRVFTENPANVEEGEGWMDALLAMKGVADKGSEHLLEYRNVPDVNPFFLFMDKPGEITRRVKKHIAWAQAAEAGGNRVRFQHWIQAVKTFPNEAVTALRTYVKEVVNGIDYDVYLDDRERILILELEREIDRIADPATGRISPLRVRTTLFPDVVESDAAKAG